MFNLKLILEYDGTGFHGWQIQKDKRTVQGELNNALLMLFNSPIQTAGASRTDAGVHAEGQVVSCGVPKKLSPNNIRAALNSLLPSDIAVLDVEYVSDDFHARHSAKSKTYRYRILNRPYPSALMRNYVFLVKKPQLNLELLKSSSAYLIGVHDFSSFKSSLCDSPSPIREILSIDFNTSDHLIEIYIEGTGFLHKMVRNIVGTMIMINRKKLDPEYMMYILNMRDRNLAGPTAPACGLSLIEVKY